MSILFYCQSISGRILEGNFYLGNYYWLSGDRDKAFEHLDRAIKLGEEILTDLMDFISLNQKNISI